MKTALITQRASVDRYGQNTDSLEAAYTEYFSGLGFHLIPVSNFLPVPGEVPDIRADVLILTGGGDVSAEYGGHKKAQGEAGIARDRTCTTLISRALDTNIPILGICYGMQLLNCHLGGSLVGDGFSAQVPTRRPGSDHRVEVNIPADISMHEEMNGVHAVNHYHNTTISSQALAPGLLSIAQDTDYDSIEAFISRELSVCAMMWHPERPAPEPLFNDNLMEYLLKKMMAITER